MPHSVEDWNAHLIRRLVAVRAALGDDRELSADLASIHLVDVLDSMGRIEFLATVAEDCGVAPAELEVVLNGRLGTIAELGLVLQQAGWSIRRDQASPLAVEAHKINAPPEEARFSLLATAVALPETFQSAEELDHLLGRPAGWLKRRAGIQRRLTWGSDDPVDAVVSAGKRCLNDAGTRPEEVVALIVTGEAPPVFPGLAALVHFRLGLPKSVPALEVANACVGLLAAMEVARPLAGEHGRVVIVAVEAPSRYLRIEPGPAGETAALFGDGAAVVVVGTQSASGAFPTIGRIHFWTDGSASDAFRIRLDDRNRLAAHMDGSRLAAAAIHAMAATLNEVLEANRIGIHALQAIVVHGGNGRLPELLARHLSYPPERVWSETTTTSNLGAASIPVAWQSRQPVPTGVIAWLAVAPGLTCAATLLGVRG